MITEETYRKALANRELPLLTLDHTWHRLFEKLEETPKIQKLTAELNRLLQEQGRDNTKSREIHTLKKKLMKDIMRLADELEKNPGKKMEKELADCKRLLLECNDKLEKCAASLQDIPKRIEETNYQLMLATTELCYDALQENTDVIENMVEKITRMRMELKKSEIIKEELLEANEQLYSYMHHIFGAQVMELFDLRYHPEDRKLTEREK